MRQGVRLTVIIPGYNNPGKRWCACLDSVLKSLGENDEVICVDDGSTFGADDLERYAITDCRVHVVRSERNYGLSHARNLGLAKACGKYVTFVDSDDVVYPGIYEKSLKKLEQNGMDVVVFGVCCQWEAERIEMDSIPSDQNWGCLGLSEVSDLYKASLFNYVWNKVYRRDFLVREHILFEMDGVPREDVIFNIECVLHGAKWCGLSEIGYQYNRTFTSLLARYKPTLGRGLELGNLAWLRFKRCFASEYEGLLLGEVSQSKIKWMLFDNLWRKASPIGVRGRYEWLVRNRQQMLCGSMWAKILRMNCSLCFICYAVFKVVRGCCYLTFVRRWHILRLNPSAKKY